MWGWVKPIKKFFDDAVGFVMTRLQITKAVDTSIKNEQIITGKLASYVGGGSLSAKDFASLFREEIKGEYIRQYLLGIGGRDQMTQSDWGKLGNMIKEQYKFLKGFEKDLTTQEMTEAQMTARADMYINSAREAFESAREKNAGALGMTEMLWVIDPAKENCDDCLGYAAMGWVSPDAIPTRPGKGDTACKTACGCSVAWRNPETQKTY